MYRYQRDNTESSGKEESVPVEEFVWKEISVEQFVKENNDENEAASYPCISKNGIIHQMFSFDIKRLSNDWKVLKKLPISSLVKNYVASVPAKDEASVVSLPATFGNSIEHFKKILYDSKELLSWHYYAASNDKDYPMECDLEEIQSVVKKLQSLLTKEQTVQVCDATKSNSSNEVGDKIDWEGLVNELLSLLTNIGQLFQPVKFEWQSENCWSDWDEEQLVGCVKMLRRLYEIKEQLGKNNITKYIK